MQVRRGRRGQKKERERGLGSDRKGTIKDYDLGKKDSRKNQKKGRLTR